MISTTYKEVKEATQIKTVILGERVSIVLLLPLLFIPFLFYTYFIIKR